MTPRAVGAKRCGAQREPGRDTEQTGPWDRCGAAAGAGGSRRQGTMAMADPEQSPSLGHWERNKKRGKKTTTTDRLQKHREVLTNALGHRPSKIAGEILGRGPAASPGDTEPQHVTFPRAGGGRAPRRPPAGGSVLAARAVAEPSPRGYSLCRGCGTRGALRNICQLPGPRRQPARTSCLCFSAEHTPSGLCQR